MRLHGFAFSFLHVLNPPLGLLAERSTEVHCHHLAEVCRGIGSAFLDDFPGAMFALWLGHRPGAAYRADSHATVNALFLPSYVFPESDYVMLAFSLNRTTLS